MALFVMCITRRVKKAWLALLLLATVTFVLAVIWKRTSSRELWLPAAMYSHSQIRVNHPPSTSKRKDVNFTVPRMDTKCSLDTFQRYILEHDSFPKGGKWFGLGQKGIQTFRPDLCTFEYNSTLPVSYFEQCLLKTDFRRFLLLGDSNGHRLHGQFLSQVKGSGFRCRTVKAESEKLKTAAYFASGTNINKGDVKVEKRGCSSCLSSLTTCVKNSTGTSLEIQLEFLIMNFYLDTEVITYRTKTLGNCPKAPARCKSSNTYQELIFLEYLKGNFPDVIIILGNSHAIRKKDLFLITASMEMLKTIVDNTVPKTTPVIWVSGPGEYDQKRPAVWRNVRYGPDHVIADKMVAVINQELFNVLKNILRRDGTNSFAFLDLDSMSEQVKSKWSLDGIHMTGMWYQHLVSYLLQSLCSSDAVTRLRLHKDNDKSRTVG